MLQQYIYAGTVVAEMGNLWRNDGTFSVTEDICCSTCAFNINMLIAFVMTPICVMSFIACLLYK